MRFSREGLLGPVGQPIGDTIRAPLPTFAEPAWFAPPVEVQEHEGALTIVFHVRGHASSELRVEVSDRNLVVWGPRLERGDGREPTLRAMRLFALPFDVAPHEVSTSRSGDLLRVRITKKVARVAPAPAASAA